LIHTHLARSPAPKEPDACYQSAASLARELGQLRRALSEQLPLDHVLLR